VKDKPRPSNRGRWEAHKAAWLAEHCAPNDPNRVILLGVPAQWAEPNPFTRFDALGLAQPRRLGDIQRWAGKIVEHPELLTSFHPTQYVLLMYLLVDQNWSRLLHHCGAVSLGAFNKYTLPIVKDRAASTTATLRRLITLVEAGRSTL
jgi:hypothetical protein